MHRAACLVLYASIISATSSSCGNREEGSREGDLARLAWSKEQIDFRICDKRHQYLVAELSNRLPKILDQEDNGMLLELQEQLQKVLMHEEQVLEEMDAIILAMEASGNILALQASKYYSAKLSVSAQYRHLIPELEKGMAGLRKWVIDGNDEMANNFKALEVEGTRYQIIDGHLEHLVSSEDRLRYSQWLSANPIPYD